MYSSIFTLLMNHDIYTQDINSKYKHGKKKKKKVSEDRFLLLCFDLLIRKITWKTEY